MANYNTVITNEGAALLASVIANHGTITFTNLKLSENDYTGQEATLTEGTFDGIFANVSVASSIVDITTIKVSATVHGYNFSGDHNLYALGVIGTDGNTTALIAICTTTNPDVLRDNASTYAFNINLTVSSTSNITVVGTTAAALYTTDIVDNLTSTATDKPLSANMGRVLNENIEAIVDVYGAKNLLDINNLGSMSAYKCHVANNGFVNDDTDTLDYFRLRLVAYDSNGQIIQVGGNNYVFAENVTSTGQKEITGFTLPVGTANVLLTHTGANINIYVNPTVNLDIIGIPLTLSFNANGINPSSIGGLDIRDIMLRDARVIDPTFAPFAETNLQLTRKTSGLSNENLFDNSWFTINQRGITSGTMSGNSYYYDRWIFTYSTNPGSFVETANGVKLTPALNDSVQWWQYLDNPIALNGKALTISILFGDGSIKHGSLVRESGTYQDVILDSNTQLQFSINATDRVAFYVKAEVTIRAVKLEVGSVSTLHLDIAPDYTTELLKCQRYFLAITAENNAPVGLGLATSAADFYASVPIPTPMRSTPSLSYSGNAYILQGATPYSTTNIEFSILSSNYLQVVVTSSGLTTGQVGMLCGGSGGLKIFLSADL